MATSQRHPTVFVSWAHLGGTDRAHADAREASVATFTALLRMQGIDADVDLYTLTDPSVDWTRFGPQRVEDCDFTLMVLSLEYGERWSGRNSPTEGPGAVLEADALHGMFQRDQAEFQRKVKAVLLPGTGEDAIPDDLRRLLRFSVSELSPEGVREIVRALTGQTAYKRPALGEIPSLPATQIVTAESSSSTAAGSAQPTRGASTVEELEAELATTQSALASLPTSDIADGAHLPWYRARAQLEHRRIAIQGTLQALRADGGGRITARVAGNRLGGSPPTSGRSEALGVTNRGDAPRLVRVDRSDHMVLSAVQIGFRVWADAATPIESGTVYLRGPGGTTKSCIGWTQRSEAHIDCVANTDAMLPGRWEVQGVRVDDKYGRIAVYQRDRTTEYIGCVGPEFHDYEHELLDFDVVP